MQVSNLTQKKIIVSLKRAQGNIQYASDNDIEGASNSFGGKSKKEKKKGLLFGRVGLIFVIILELIELYIYTFNV